MLPALACAVLPGGVPSFTDIMMSNACAEGGYRRKKKKKKKTVLPEATEEDSRRTTVDIHPIPPILTTLRRL